MATWEDFRGSLDSYLARLPPDALAQIREYQRTGTMGGVGDQAAATRAAELLRNHLGIDMKAAANLAMLSYNVYQRPRDAIPEDFGALSAEGRVGDRSTYQSDEAYKQALLSRYGLQSEAQRAGTPEEQQAAAEGPARMSLTDRINAFIEAMQGPPAAGDPVVSQLERSGQAAAGLAGGRAGISARSGLAGVQSAASAKAAVMPYLQQRQGLAAQGLQLANQRDLGLGQLQQGWTQLQMQQADMAAAAKQAQATAQGQMVGGAIAAVPAVALAPYTGGTSLGLIGAGSAIGGGAAGSLGGAPNYAGIQKPKAGVNPYTGY